MEICKKEILYFTLHEKYYDIKSNGDNCIREAHIKDKNRLKPPLSREFQTVKDIRIQVLPV